MKKVTYTLAFLALFGMLATTAVLARDGGDDNDGSDDSDLRVQTQLRVRTSDDLGDDEEGDDSRDENAGKGTPKSGSTTFSTKAVDLLEKTKLRAAAEIDRRIGRLEDFSEKAEDLRRMDDATKASLTAAIDAQIQSLTDLKAKITTQTDSTTIKQDIKTLSDTHRAFTLVMPKAAIIATADKITVTADLMAKLSSKLQARIDEVKTAGGSTSTLDAALTDFDAKLADAKVQAKAAVDLTATLKADDGTQATFAANNKILKDARAKLKTAREDLRIARQDAEKIVNGVKGKHTGEDKPKTEVNTETEVEVEND